MLQLSILAIVVLAITSRAKSIRKTYIDDSNHEWHGSAKETPNSHGMCSNPKGRRPAHNGCVSSMNPFGIAARGCTLGGRGHGLSSFPNQHPHHSLQTNGKGIAMRATFLLVLAFSTLNQCIAPTDTPLSDPCIPDTSGPATIKNHSFHESSFLVFRYIDSTEMPSIKDTILGGVSDCDPAELGIYGSWITGSLALGNQDDFGDGLCRWYFSAGGVEIPDTIFFIHNYDYMKVHDSVVIDCGYKGIYSGQVWQFTSNNDYVWCWTFLDASSL